MWGLTSLLAAFVDLTIAYLLLFASALAFFASKFLNILGLNLPCPCHGLFFDIHSRSLCLNRLLVDFPVQKVSDVLLCVKQAYPFNGCTCTTTSNSSSIIALNDSSNRVLRDYDASCSSLSDTRRSIDGSCGDRKDLIVRAEKYDVKGKGILLSRRHRARFRGRRKHVNDHYVYGNNGLRGFVDDDDLCVKDKFLSTLELHEDVSQGDLTSPGDEKREILLLKLALEQERASRAALYIDLEKERSASATAADEAMSMILRLQEEKAIIEMESRQYQRIIEEKSAHDAEEMNILKEILVRREREKLFLEKEVEGYRQMISLQEYDGDGDDGEQLFSGDALDMVEQSISRGPQEGNFVMKIDSSDTEHVEENESLSPEEKIIVTCDGIESSNPYEDTSVTQRASSSQVLHEKDYFVPIETSVMKNVNTATNNASSSRTDNGMLVKRSSSETSETTNDGLHLPLTRPRALSLLTELRRSSMSRADKEMLSTDPEVEQLIEKLKLVREDREKPVSLLIENQEQRDIGTKSLDDIEGQIRESNSRTQAVQKCIFRTLDSLQRFIENLRALKQTALP